MGSIWSRYLDWTDLRGHGSRDRILAGSPMDRTPSQSNAAACLEFSVMMEQARYFIRTYIDEGRLQNLIWFILAAYGIAFLEWSLSPEIGPLWLPPVRIADDVIFIILFALAFAWICVVGVGIRKCGWPGLLMLASVKWGLFPFFMIGFLYWACMFRGDCL
jgi:hypothetical protein